MLWLWILGGIVLLLILFCLMRFGVQVTFSEIVTADVMVGPLKIRVAPSKPGKAKKKREPEEKKPPSVPKKRKKLPLPTPEDLLSAVRELWPPFRRALRRTRRSIRIRPLRLSVTLGGENDPAWAAETYGKASAAVWSVMPALEELLTIPDPQIHLGVDFDRKKTEVRGEVGVSIRLGTLIALGLDMGIPALLWFLQYRKKSRPPEEKEKKPAQTTDAAA